uniref:Uncharacterized protein n=1 Tax=Meloidogyne hapla TaxID=6305 RepID=A0A1I8BEP3_MELHA
MIARYFTSILFILFFVHLSYVNAEKNHNETNTHIFLTDMTNTHDAIPYLNMDQCMLRPDQKEHGSFGLIFFRPDFYLCDKLLICYPSQLVGNNTRNGIIASIPYRLRESKPNNITKQCEEKRQEFCNEAKNKHLCSLGQPASTILHGIMLTTEYLTLDQTEVYVTTISLSITKKKFVFIYIYTKFVWSFVFRLQCLIS